MRFASHDGKIAMNCGPFTEVEIACGDGSVAGDGATGIEGYGAESDGNVAAHVAMDMNGAEGARNIAYGLALGDSDVGAEAGTIVATGMPGKSGGREKEDQNGCEKKSAGLSAHVEPRW